MKFSNCFIQNITNVRKSGDEEGVFFCDVEVSIADGFPFEKVFYCARADDFAESGKWVYQQIVDGSFAGEITQLLAGVDPMTGLPADPPVQSQPRSEIPGDVL
jgi:hypothetical protein